MRSAVRFTVPYPGTVSSLLDPHAYLARRLPDGTYERVELPYQATTGEELAVFPGGDPAIAAIPAKPENLEDNDQAADGNDGRPIAAIPAKSENLEAYALTLLRRAACDDYAESYPPGYIDSLVQRWQQQEQRAANSDQPKPA